VRSLDLDAARYNQVINASPPFHQSYLYANADLHAVRGNRTMPRHLRDSINITPMSGRFLETCFFSQYCCMQHARGFSRRPHTAISIGRPPTRQWCGMLEVYLISPWRKWYYSCIHIFRGPDQRRRIRSAFSECPS